MAPSLVATSSGIATSPSVPKQERGPQDFDRAGPPPEPVPTVVIPPARPPSLGESPTHTVSPTTYPTSTNADINLDSTTLTFSFTTVASTKTSLTELATIATTNSLMVGESPANTFATSTATRGTSAATPSEETQAGAWKSDPASSPTETDIMSSPSPTPRSVNSDANEDGASTTTIVLSTVLSVIGVVLITVGAYLCTGKRRRKMPMFKRGITPIGDDEIETWKSNRSAEKVVDTYTMRPNHSQNPSTSTSARRTHSLIQYQNGGRSSFEPASPRSFIGGTQSFDLPRPPGAVLARAPNARSGLTDEMVPGDDPFLPSPKRHPSRLHKLPPNSPSIHTRTKGSRSSSLRSYAEAAWRQAETQDNSTPSPRVSSDAYSRSYHNHHRIYSNSSIPPPPRLSFGDNEQFTGLSPPPSRRNDNMMIGLAVG